MTRFSGTKAHYELKRMAWSLGCFVRIAGLIVLLLLTLRLANNLFMHGKIWPEMLSEESLQVKIVSSQDKFDVGENGLLTVDIENTSGERIDVASFSLSLPHGFFDGFIINYPVEPSPLSISRGVSSLVRPEMAFDGVVLESGESFAITLPLIANTPGDYAGSFGLRVNAAKASEIDGSHLWSQEIPIIIVPPKTGS